MIRFFENIIDGRGFFFIWELAVRKFLCVVDALDGLLVDCSQAVRCSLACYRSTHGFGETMIEGRLLSLVELQNSLVTLDGVT